MQRGLAGRRGSFDAGRAGGRQRDSDPDPCGRMGGAGFEPAKACANRFTVCPLWPLGYPPGEHPSRPSGAGAIRPADPAAGKPAGGGRGDRSQLVQTWIALSGSTLARGRREPLATWGSSGGVLGASGGTRTHNRLITNQVLCQLSYAGERGRRAGSQRPARGTGGPVPPSAAGCRARRFRAGLGPVGAGKGAERIRTCRGCARVWPLFFRGGPPPAPGAGRRWPGSSAPPGAAHVFPPPARAAGGLARAPPRPVGAGRSGWPWCRSGGP